MSAADALLEMPELAALGPGPRPGRQSIPDLDRALADIFGGTKLSAPQHSLVRALIYLWHDHLDEAHVLCQDVATADGSFVHGILHRREPDYGNAKYWFHRVGLHAAFADIARRAATLPASPAESALLARFTREKAWDPFAFIDCCQEDPRSGFLQRVQKTEFSALLDYLAVLL